MKQPTLLFLFLLLINFILSACTPMSANSTRHAICNKLKSDLVFSGATSNTRQADIQRAEKSLQQENYDSNDCSSY